MNAEKFFKDFNKHGSKSLSVLTKWCDDIGVVDDTMNSYLVDCMQKQVPASFDGYNKYVQNAIVSTEQLTLSQKAATVATKFLAAAGNMLAVWAINKAFSVAVGIIDDMIHSEENLRKSASELGSELINNTSSIDNYKKEIDDLKSIINDSSSSFNDVSQARVDLMAIQDELIEKFGTEKGVIENITESINGQTDALDELSKQSYFGAKNKFNEKTIGDKFKDWLSFGSTDDERIQSNIDKMVSKMRYSAYELETTGNEVLDNLIAKTYGLNIFDNMYGDGQHFSITGTLDEIQEKLYGIQSLSSGFELSTSFENSFTEISNDVNDALANYKNLYDQYVLWEKILNNTPNNQYDEQFNLINEAKEAYNEAVISNNEELIKKASDEYAKTVTDAINLANQNYDYDVADYFEAMYPELQQLVGEWQFNLDFEPNTGSIKDKINNALDLIDGKSDGKNNFSVEDIQHFNPNVASQEQIEAYGDLNNVAEEYELTLKQLVTLLQKMELIQSQTKSDLLDKLIPSRNKSTSGIQSVFDDALKGVNSSVVTTWVEGLTEEEAILANSKEFEQALDEQKEKLNGATLSAEDYEIALQQIKDAQNFSESAEDFSSYEGLTEIAETYTKATDTLRSAIFSVNDALAEQAENGSISIDTMLAMVDAGYATALQFDATTGACTINKEAMLALVQAKIQNQIADLQLLQSNIQQKLADDGNTARESANGFYDLAKAKLTSASAEQLASMKQFNDAEAQINALQNAMKNINKIGSGSYSTKARSSSVGASSASKSAAKTMEEIQREWKEYLSKYLALYKAELDAGLIDLHTFLTKSRSMLDEFYRDGKISAKDYWDSVKDLYESQLSLYDKVLSAVTRRIDKEIDSIHDIIDGLENQNNALQEQLDIYDSVLSEVDRVYDNEIEKLEDQKQAIQDVIDAMSDENDERERAMALQQAQYNLARALSQNSNYIYKDGQFIYTTDETAIREAQDSFKDAQFDIDIAELEKQQDALDDYINVLEQYKNMWSEIADTYQTSQDAINATAILGQNYAQLILQNNLSDITNFKNQYVEIQAQINNNDELIQSYEEKIEYYESLKEQWSDISKAYQQAQEDQYAAMVMGANWESDVLSGRLDVLNNFKEQYIAIQQAITNAALEAARAQAAAQTAQSASGSSGGGSGGNSGSNTTSTPTKSYHVVHKLSNGFKTQGEASSKIGYYDGANGVFKDEDNQWYVYKKETYSSHMFSSISEAKDYIKKELAPWGKYGIIKYAQGTTNAKKGLNLVSEDEYGDELIINHDGTAVIAKGEQFYPFKGGETVINASETKKLLANMSNLVPLQEDASPFSRLKLHPIDYGSMVMNSLNLLDSSALSGNIINQNNSSTIKQEITFHCPNLTDKSGIEYVERELQSLTTRAMQFDWSK